ncbi:hypothetical protein MRB53_030587 [Persea americana]|uniref:Uncharacterized protein n=1 Tax=Persea americana TaxID=3435 RepID=A0ACC2KLQ9_PERAE|nr:hypothetical protein MRB53_030587 [Persea americana]
MPGFFQTVKNAWDTDVSGTPLFIVVRKLSILKRRLIEWKKSQGDIPMKLSAAYLQLETLQSLLASDLQHLHIQEQERMARFELDQLLRAEESMYKQRACDLAVNLGDSNTKYSKNQSPDLSHITPHGVLTDGDALALMRPVTVAEIEDVVKSANPNKAPGPDGFTAHFFKVSSSDNTSLLVGFFRCFRADKRQCFRAGLRHRAKVGFHVVSCAKVVALVDELNSTTLLAVDEEELTSDASFGNILIGDLCSSNVG